MILGRGYPPPCPCMGRESPGRTLPHLVETPPRLIIHDGGMRTRVRRVAMTEEMEEKEFRRNTEKRERLPRVSQKNE